MVRNSINIEIPSNFSKTGDQIESTFFGGNLLFSRDQVEEGSSFNKKVDALNIDFIRYPGGGVTNKLFDLTDPDKNWDEDARNGFITPLSEFVQYAAMNAKTYALVLPVERYMSEIHTGEKTKAEAVSELRGFLTLLNNGAYGELLPEIIEVGNEYYWNDFTGSRDADAALYADIAYDFAKEIRKEMGSEVKIAIQASPRPTPNAIVVQEFAQDSDLVDMLIVHNYPETMNRIDGMHTRWTNSLNSWERSGIEAEVFLSEWNTATNRPEGSGLTMETATVEQGIAGAIAMIELAANYLADGVDFATVWPLQQNTINDLGGDAGDLGEHRGSRLTDNNLTLKGEVFRAMSESLVGKQVVDMDSQFDLDRINESARFKNELYVRAYEDDKEIVLFVSAWDNSERAPVSINLDTQFHEYETMSITVVDEAYYRPDKAPIVQEEKFISSVATSSIVLPINDDFEIIRVTIQKIDPMLAGTANDDVISGADAADLLFGLEGDDILLGGKGRDTLGGGDGSDTLSGGGGRDILNGGDGDDQILGSKGWDRLNGGDGSDLLIGGKGRDVLIGAAGEDTLGGGYSHDYLHGGAGNDVLKGHSGNDKLFGGKGADVIKGGDGNDQISGQHGSDVLSGGNGDDTLDTGKGENRAFGGPGDDVFLLGSGKNDFIAGGEGADQFVFEKTGKGSTYISDFDYTEDELVIDPASVVNVERMGFQWNIQTEHHDILVNDIYHHTTFDAFSDLMG